MSRDQYRNDFPTFMKQRFLLPPITDASLFLNLIYEHYQNGPIYFVKRISADHPAECGTNQVCCSFLLSLNNDFMFATYLALINFARQTRQRLMRPVEERCLVPVPQAVFYSSCLTPNNLFPFKLFYTSFRRTSLKKN